MATGLRARALKKRREALGVGQIHLSRVLGISQPILSVLEAEIIRMPRGFSPKIAAAMERIADGPPEDHFKGCGCKK